MNKVKNGSIMWVKARNTSETSGFEVSCTSKGCSTTERIGLSPSTPPEIVEKTFHQHGWYMKNGTVCKHCMKKRRGPKPKDYDPNAGKVEEKQNILTGFNLHDLLRVARNLNIHFYPEHSWANAITWEAVLYMPPSHPLHTHKLWEFLAVLQEAFPDTSFSHKLGCDMQTAVENSRISATAYLTLHIFRPNQ